MSKPVRLRLSRTRGFNLQALSVETNGLPAINVARPSAWGNPFVVGQPSGHLFNDGGDPTPMVSALTRQQCIDFFEMACGGILAPEMYPAGHRWTEAFRKRFGQSPVVCMSFLEGRNLACWCEPGALCHADVLLERARPARLRR